MRIAHILPYSQIGGTEIAQLNLIRASRKAGMDGFVVVPPDAEAVRTFFEKAGVEAMLHPRPEPGIRRGAAYYRSSSEAAELLRDRGVAAMHCANVLGGCHWSFAGRLARIPVICHVRNRFEHLSFREKLSLRFVNHWVFVSRNSWERFCIPVRPADGIVLYDAAPSGPDTGDTSESVRTELGLAPETTLAGMFCRVAPQKDFETLIRAAAILSNRFPRLRYLIAGEYGHGEKDRQYFARIQSLLQELGIADRFVFTGFRRDVARLMRACDLSVLSTHEEGLPLVLLEAMSHARPVVATAVDGIPELIRDGETGLLTPHANAPALAAALERLLSDPALAARLGEAGRRMVETRFSREQFDHNVAEMYRRFAPSKQ